MWFDPSPYAYARWLVSVVNFDEVVLFVLIVVVLIIFVVVILVNLIEDVEREFHAQLGEEDIVVGEEGVAQRQLGGFERGVIGLVSIACDVEVVLESVEQARQCAAGISSHRSQSTVRTHTFSGQVELRTDNGHHEVRSLDLCRLLGSQDARLPIGIQ